ERCEADGETAEVPFPWGRGKGGHCQKETSIHPFVARSGMENGGGLGQAAPLPRGDLQHHTEARCGAVGQDGEICAACGADGAMGGGDGGSPRKEEGKVL